MLFVVSRVFRLVNWNAWTVGVAGTRPAQGDLEIAPFSGDTSMTIKSPHELIAESRANPTATQQGGRA